jgi:hypothetical protein
VTDRERLELAEVFSAVLDSRMKRLYAELAAMCVEILDQFAGDLAQIMESHNREGIEKLIAARARRENGLTDRESRRISELIAAGL